MDANDVKRLCTLGENSKVQYKLVVDDPSKIAKEITAFANHRGGIILVGVEDKTGVVKGLSYEQVQRFSRDIGNAANEWVRPTVYLHTETVSVDGKTVLAVHVDEGKNKPYKDLGGNIWIKQGSDKRRVTENAEILSLFQESGSFRPDERGVRNTTVNDIDLLLVSDYLDKYYGKQASDFGLTLEQLLQNLQILTAAGQATLAGLLFFGKSPQRFEPAFEIKAVSFFGNDMGGVDYRDSRNITGTIPRMFSDGMAFLNANLHHLQAGQSFNSVGKLEVSELALRELLQNALVHRDYLEQAPVRIMLFDNRVEIVSPGGLPRGIEVEDILFGRTKQRNPLMAAFCARTMDYRGLGTGILRARKEERSLRFENIDGGQFKAVIDRPEDFRAIPDYLHQRSAGGSPVSDHCVHEELVLPPPVSSRPDVLRACPSLSPKVAGDANRLLAFCRYSYQGVLEMMAAVGYTSRTSFRRKLLTPLLEAGLLELEYPHSPNSPKQRYRARLVAM